MSNQLTQSGYTVEEETELYDKQLQDILDNLRWYLDNLDNMVEYRVIWKDYRSKTPTLPHKYVRKPKPL